MQNNSYNGNPKIKADGVQHQWSQHEVEEYIKCRDSVEYFCKNYVKVISLDHGLVPFELRGYQTKLVKHYSENRFSIVLAPRQSGKCHNINTLVTIRNKITNEIETISIGELYNRAKISLQQDNI
jgi:hypothetical protein